VVQTDSRVVRLMANVRNPRNRLREIQRLCTAEKICRGGEEVAKKEGDADADADGGEGADGALQSTEAAKKKDQRGHHGGCGKVQPKYSREGLGIVTKAKNDEGGTVQKTPLMAQQACRAWNASLHAKLTCAVLGVGVGGIARAGGV